MLPAHAAVNPLGDHRARSGRWIGPGAWRLADALVAALLAGPVEALLLFLLSPDRPLTLRDFLATLIALSPQILLLFVLVGPLVVWLGRLLGVARTTRYGVSPRYVLRFLCFDLALLSLAAVQQASLFAIFASTLR